MFEVRLQKFFFNIFPKKKNFNHEQIKGFLYINENLVQRIMRIKKIMNSKQAYFIILIYISIMEIQLKKF